MSGKAAWPTELEAGNRIVALGLADSAPTGLQTFLDASVAKWESMTGYVPFLEGEEADYLFDPPSWGDSELLLRCGFTAVTEVATGVSYGNAAGTVLTAVRDYDTFGHGGGDSLPIIGIRFYSGLSGGPRSIKVTGTKGYAALIPDDAWNAVLGMAINEWLDSASESGGDLSRIKQGPVELEYAKGEDGSKSPYAARQDEFECAARRYMRI